MHEIIIYVEMKLLVLDRNTWNHLNVCKQMID